MTDGYDSWRSEYETKLRAPNGWLAVAGLFWLKDGLNTLGSDASNDVVLPSSVDPKAGFVVLRDGRVFLNDVEELVLDEKKVQIGPCTIMAIKRGSKIGLRLWDPNSQAIQHFSGLKFFDVNPAARIVAQWIPFAQPKTLTVLNVLDIEETYTVPGQAQFEWGGQTWAVEPVEEDDHLFLMFRDQTSLDGDSYGSGRFLTVDLPKDSQVVLDFNKARNPPCSFTQFATCPIPPKQNRISVRIEAGEKKYGDH